MKKILSILLLVSSLYLSAQTADGTFERVCISTDRGDYLAGERMWCSAFCFDISRGGVLSDCSSIAYLQLVSALGPAASAKIALEHGRGCGWLDIPEGLATGNYSLVAYTALNRNEDGYDFLQNARRIAIYNPLSEAKIPEGVTVSESLAAAEEMAVPVGASSSMTGTVGIQMAVSAEVGGSIPIWISNLDGRRAASMSVSVWHDDGLAQTAPGSLAVFDKGSASGLHYTARVVPEYDGEVLYASIVGPDKDLIFKENSDVTAYISTIGNANDTYTGLISPDGQLYFKTYNIYGNKDMVCEVDGMSTELTAHLDIASPFENLVATDTTRLVLCKSMKQALLERSASLSAEKRWFADSLPELLPRKEQILLRQDDCKRYALDDYTRFPTMKEVLVEIIMEVRSRGKGEDEKIQILSESPVQSGVSWDPSLVLLDGVPIFRHRNLMDFDAMLIKNVDVWQSPFYIGGRSYSGVVNFETVDGNITYIDFGSNVRIVDFQGASYPAECTLRHKVAGGRDLRQTIWWKPLQQLEAGEKQRFDCMLPDYPGKFDVTVEGVLEDGTPFCTTSSFIVE